MHAIKAFRRITRRQLLLLGGAIGSLGASILAHQAWLLHQARQTPVTAIVVLGGGIQREIFTAQLAQRYPHLPIVISSGSPTPCVYRVLVEENQVDWDRVIIDWRATDTVTNFTATLPYLREHNHRHVLLVATDEHMQRAGMLARIIWGRYGIAQTPATFPGAHRSGLGRSLLDGLRALAWLAFGDIVVAGQYRSPTQIHRATTQRQARCEVNGTAQLPPDL